MSDRKYLSEFVQGTRTAHVLLRIVEKDFVVFCICCGHEAESEAFGTQQLAEDWAEDWVQHEVELTALVELAGPEGCGCQNH